MSPAARIGAVAILFIVAVVFGVTSFLGSSPEAAPPTITALADIPPGLLPVYQEAAATSCKMPWAVLAAIGSVESDHGRSSAPGVHSGTNEKGAMGPMQMLGPTWDRYGVDGDRNGTKDPYSPADAIWGAAANLCANGAASGDAVGIRGAVFAYNHDTAYVEQVLTIATSYGQSVVAPGGTTAALLDSPTLVLPPNARRDLEDAVVDQRVIDFLAWASQRHRIAVSVLRTGHAQYVRGTDRISNHFVGRAVDIVTVDGEPVAPGSVAPRAFAQEIGRLVQGRADEVLTPWADLRFPGFGADQDHQDHIHLGWQ